MRIFYIEYVYSPLYSGCAIKTGRICRRLKKRGFDPAVLTIRFKGLKGFEEVDGVPVHRISSYGFSDSFGRLRRATFIVNLICYLVAHSSRFDLLYTSGNDWGVFLAIGLARILRKGTVHAFSMYGEDNAGKVRSSKLGRWKFFLLSKADKFICSSTALLKDAEATGIVPGKLTWLQNGVDLEVFKSDLARQTALREKYRIPPTHRVLVFLGSLSRRKGADLLLEVFARLRERDRRLYLIIVGSRSVDDCPSLDENFVKSLEATVERHNLAEGIRFTGLLGDPRAVAEYLQLADVFVFPTRMEGSPNALLEAMACGLPSVVTLLPGITDDIIKTGENGFLVPLEASAFTREISGLLEDPERRRAMGARARETVRKDFSCKGFVEKHAALYQEVMAKKNRPVRMKKQDAGAEKNR